jgi:DNA-binding Lrp family transcriptional regulator
MRQAYVLVNVESGSEDTVLKQLNALDFIDEAYVSLGSYDLVLKIKKETVDDLKEALSTKIRNINQVRSTLTLVVV